MSLRFCRCIFFRMAERARKPRARPNPDLSAACYLNILVRWCMQPPARTIENRLGALIHDSRQVRPSSMSRVLGLVDMLLEAGAPGVVNGTRMEQSWSRLVGQRVDRFASQGPALANLPHNLTNHVMSHLAMLRLLVSEDDNAMRHSTTRYAKTGGFRRVCSASDWIQLTPILKKFQAFTCEDNAHVWCPAGPKFIKAEVDERTKSELGEHEDAKVKGEPKVKVEQDVGEQVGVADVVGGSGLSAWSDDAMEAQSASWSLRLSEDGASMRSDDAFSDLQLDDDGWPVLFAQVMQGSAGRRKNRNQWQDRQ